MTEREALQEAVRALHCAATELRGAEAHYCACCQRGWSDGRPERHDQDCVAVLCEEAEGRCRQALAARLEGESG